MGGWVRESVSVTEVSERMRTYSTIHTIEAHSAATHKHTIESFSMDRYTIKACIQPYTIEARSGPIHTCTRVHTRFGAGEPCAAIFKPLPAGSCVCVGVCVCVYVVCVYVRICVCVCDCV